MKKICYQKLMETEQALLTVELRCADSTLEANLTIAQAEAYNGEVTVEDLPDEEAEIVPVSRGGTGMTSNPSLLVNLASTTAASVFASNPRPGVTGTLPVTMGGTGAATAAAALAALGAAASDDCFKRLAKTGEDADTTVVPVIFTNIGTLPSEESQYWYIHTTFYSSVSATSPRMQLAYGYGLQVVYQREYRIFNVETPGWTDWVKVGGVCGAQIATGSYVGTGTYGEENPNSLTFSFIPKIVIVQLLTSSTGYSSTYAEPGFLWQYGQDGQRFSSFSGNTSYPAHAQLKFSFSDESKTLSWYSEVESNDALEYQANMSKRTYGWTAIG